jgi:hypothetical protein
MKSAKFLAIAVSTFVLSVSSLPNALAQCGRARVELVRPTNWHLQFGGGHLMRAASISERSDGNEDAQPIKNVAPAVHSRRQRGRSAKRHTNRQCHRGVASRQDGDHELRTASARWGLLHGRLGSDGQRQIYAQSLRLGGNDTTNVPVGIGNPVGPTRIVEEVAVSPDGKHFAGTFTLDAYDTSGNKTAHIVGVVTATRITMDTTVGDLL